MVESETGGVVVVYRKKSGWFWALIVLLCLAPSVVAADEGDEDSGDEERLVVQLNDEQLDLYNRALDAMDEEPPDTQTAQRLLESALIAGEDINLLYLTLGRAQQLGERCEEALESFEAAETASLMEGVEEEQILARLHNYRSQVESDCDGILYIDCRDPETELTSDDVDDLECNQVMEVEPGRYDFEATLMEVSTLATVEVVGGRRGEVTIDLDVEERRLIDARDQARQAVAAGLEEADDEMYRQNMRREIEAELGREITDDELYEELPDELRPVAEEEPSVEAGYLANQISLSPAFGGYAVQMGDGFADGGVLFGGTGHLYVGYAISDGVAADLRLGGDYLDTYALAFKEGEGSDDEGTLDWTAMRFEGQGHLWLEVFGIGGFAEYRHNSLEFPRGSAGRSSFVAGPAITLSGSNIYRGHRYMNFSARWGLLGDGDIDVFSFRLEHGVGYAQIGVEFGSLPGVDDDEVTGIEGTSLMRGGEYGMLTLGARVSGLL